jgi:hypothetical protein
MTEEMLYVIGLGGLEDWDAGRGSLYWILDSRGKHALPVFTTPGKARDYWEANSGVRERLEMADSAPVTHQGPLLQNRFILMPLAHESLVMAAAKVKANYLVRDPRPGTEQEVLWLRD